VLDTGIVQMLARHWSDGWNGRKLDVIMEPFAANVVFSSPFVATQTGDPSTSTIVGYDALRSYIADALRRSGDVRYTLDGAYAGTDTVVLVYTCHLPDGSDKPGADLMRVDADGKVTEWRCHYTSDPKAWRD
jgi:hypothetical protein